MSETSYIEMEQVPKALRPMIEAICRVGSELSVQIARGPLEERHGAELGSNTDGDTQKALDVIADKAFARALRGTGVRHYASEERETVEVLDPAGDFALAIDPLDGSSNIDVNVSIGTIFSIYPAREIPDDSFLRSSEEQIAAGYLIYGPQTTLMVTFGNGVLQYVRDPLDGRFKLTVQNLTIPEGAREFAINASNYRHWSKPIRAYIDDCLAGVEGPRDKNFNMRWVASLVAETHRILTRGGIFLYPSDDRPGYEQGRLRMVYECAPIAMLVEQAGGQASSGCDRLLGQSAETLHARTPLIFGSADKVSRVCAYHDLPEQEVSALFGNRGLFRA